MAVPVISVVGLIFKAVVVLRIFANVKIRKFLEVSFGNNTGWSLHRFLLEINVLYL
jgi:uncharacterized membrane protein YjjB (DUF3815 family)